MKTSAFNTIMKKFKDTKTELGSDFDDKIEGIAKKAMKMNYGLENYIKNFIGVDDHIGWFVKQIDEMNESAKEVVIAQGSKDKIQGYMDKLQAAYESGEFKWQEYSSYTKDYKTYLLVTDEPAEYRKVRTKLKSIIGIK